MNRRYLDALLFGIVLLLAVSVVKSRGSRVESGGARVENRQPSTATQQSSTATQQPSTATRQSTGMTEAEFLLMMKTDKKVQQLTRQGYTTGYSSEWRCPVWTAWQLTDAHTTGTYSRKGVGYREDTEVPQPRATNADYSRSGYDRGHMCPSGDNKWSRQAQEDCFLFTNMCPQAHNLNGGDWNDLEMKCRTWAKRYGDIYIICGPVFKRDRPRKTIGRNKVWVPDGFYKVVMCLVDEPKAIGFYYDNDDGHRPMADYVRTVDEIEEMTGLDFFSGVRDDWERQMEAHADLGEW